MTTKPTTHVRITLDIVFTPADPALIMVGKMVAAEAIDRVERLCSTLDVGHEDISAKVELVE